MESSCIILNYSVPPSIDDLETLSSGVLEALPEEISRHCSDLIIVVEDIAEESILDDLDLEDPFELLALYRSGKEISPGVERKVANDDDTLVLYRRSILDMWCETGDDIQSIMRQVMIEELGRFFEFSDDDMEEMTQRHY